MTKLFIALVLTMLGFTAFAQPRGTMTITGSAAEAMVLDMDKDLRAGDKSVSRDASDFRTTYVRDTQSAYIECSITNSHGPKTPEYNCTMTAY